MSHHLVPEFLTSRANSTLLLYDGVGEADAISALQCLSFFFTHDCVLDSLDTLIDSLDGDFEIGEYSLSMLGCFSDAAELVSTEVIHREFMKDVQALEGDELEELPIFQREFKPKHELPEGVLLKDVARDHTGTSVYLLSDLHGENALWIAADRAYMAGQKYISMQADFESDSLEKAKEFCDNGYTIPRHVDGTTDEASHDPIAVHHKEMLEASRYLRAMYPRSTKSMTSFDCSTTGTTFKFEPICDYVYQHSQGGGDREINSVLICGSGRIGSTGMCQMVSKYFPKALVTVYEPQAKKSTFPEHWNIVKECYEEQSPVDNYDFVFTDVAVGDGAQFCQQYVSKFSALISKRYGYTSKQPAKYLVYKESCDYMCIRKCKRIFFGRGHNMEMFVLAIPSEPAKFVTREDAARIMAMKRDCDHARNLAHCFGLKAKRNDQPDVPAPIAIRNGGNSAKRWGKHRKYTVNYTLGEYVKVLGGIDTDELDPSDPVRLLVDVIRYFSITNPDATITDVADGNVSRLIKAVRESVGLNGKGHKEFRDKANRSDKNKKPQERENYKISRQQLAHTVVLREAYVQETDETIKDLIKEKGAALRKIDNEASLKQAREALDSLQRAAKSQTTNLTRLTEICARCEDAITQPPTRKATPEQLEEHKTIKELILELYPALIEAIETAKKKEFAKSAELRKVQAEFDKYISSKTKDKQRRKLALSISSKCEYLLARADCDAADAKVCRDILNRLSCVA